MAPALGLGRYMNALAPDMQQLNNRLVQTLVPSGLQSVEEIEAIVHQATRAVHWPNWPPKAKVGAPGT